MIQPHRVTERIELCEHEGRVGFIMYFQDGASEAFLFNVKTAHDLYCKGLMSIWGSLHISTSDLQAAHELLVKLESILLESVQQAQHAAQLPHSGVGIGDAAKLRLIKSRD